MWECMISETRKGRRRTPLPLPARVVVVQPGGVRRDRTSQLLRLRGTRAEPRPLHSCLLTEEYAEAAQVIASLATRLAQHNGLRQFSASFSTRAPPLELRMLLPELEAADFWPFSTQTV